MNIARGERVCIRLVNEDEMPALLEVYHQSEDFLALGPVATASVAMVEADLRLSKGYGGLFCGIYEAAGGKMVGVVDYVPSGWEGLPHQAYLSLLMIAAPYRDRGIGAEVVRLVEEVICGSGQITRIAAGVQTNNPSAIRFWQRMGYQIVSGPKWYPDGTEAFDLLKIVTEQIGL